MYSDSDSVGLTIVQVMRAQSTVVASMHFIAFKFMMFIWYYWRLLPFIYSIHISLHNSNKLNSCPYYASCLTQHHTTPQLVSLINHTLIPLLLPPPSPPSPLTMPCITHNSKSHFKWCPAYPKKENIKSKHGLGCLLITLFVCAFEEKKWKRNFMLFTVYSWDWWCCATWGRFKLQKLFLPLGKLQIPTQFHWKNFWVSFKNF